MARDETLICDICRKPTAMIVLKLFLSPAGRVHRDKAPHSNYTHHLDVGECCENRLMSGFNWHPRLSAKEYAKRRTKAKLKRNHP